MNHSPLPKRIHLSRMHIAGWGACALLLGGCNQASAPQPEAAPPAAAASAAAVVQAPAPPATAAPVAYAPPTPDQLYQLVAPVALYPDKLVAQILAGSTYPAQVTQADQWLAQNGGLKGGSLSDAADRQAWDPSIKSLTAFRTVLDQMAGNLPWTTALGQAYYNDPDDVMNAIQVMRQRASRAGRLKSSPKLTVATNTAAPIYAPDPDARIVYAGPPIIQAPPQRITIAPAQPDVVYVPAYDPQVIYGEPVRVYPGYRYAPPPVQVQLGYSDRQVATVGAVGFGLGVVVGAALERHGWGWNAWSVDWGHHGAHLGNDPRPAPNAPARAADRPAVVYNNQTYVSRSETVINNNVHNVYNSVPSPRLQQPDAQQERALEQARNQAPTTQQPHERDAHRQAQTATQPALPVPLAPLPHAQEHAPATTQVNAQAQAQAQLQLQAHQQARAAEVAQQARTQERVHTQEPARHAQAAVREATRPVPAPPPARLPEADKQAQVVQQHARAQEAATLQSQNQPHARAQVATRPAQQPAKAHEAARQEPHRAAQKPADRTPDDHGAKKAEHDPQVSSRRATEHHTDEDKKP